jgi:hypothetical protein
MEQVVRKTPGRSKPKAVKNASAKKVKRATRTATAAKRATQTATSKSSASKSATSKSASWKNDQSANAVMKMGTDAIQEFFKNGASDTQNKMMSFMGKEGAAHFAKSADAATRSMGEIFNIGRDNVETAVACSNIAVNASKNMGAELFSFANKSFSQNIEMSKELLGCRTLNDMFDLQSRVMKTNIDNLFNESVKLSELMFQCATQVSEPINECVSETTHRLSKTLSEAA